jgi:hypothetical protein
MAGAEAESSVLFEGVRKGVRNGEEVFTAEQWRDIH